MRIRSKLTRTKSNDEQTRTRDSSKLDWLFIWFRVAFSQRVGGSLSILDDSRLKYVLVDKWLVSNSGRTMSWDEAALFTRVRTCSDSRLAWWFSTRTTFLFFGTCSIAIQPSIHSLIHWVIIRSILSRPLSYNPGQSLRSVRIKPRSCRENNFCVVMKFPCFPE